MSHLESRSASTEIRFDADSPDDLAILDAHCQSTGESRKDVMCKLLNEFAKSEFHKAKSICRALHCNPLASASERNEVAK